MKKIVFFIGSMGRGGAERVISLLANDYAQRGWETQICMLLENKVGYELNPQIKVFDYTGTTSNRIMRIPYWLRIIRSHIKKEDPYVIISFVARINILVLASCCRLNNRIIISERNDPRYDGRGYIVNLLTSILYRKAERVVFQTNTAKQFFGKEIQKKGVIIPNPIYVPERETRENPSKVFVSVGRLLPQKNHKLLLKAFEQIHYSFPEYRLCIYGEGELRNELINEIKRRGLDDCVNLPGNFPDIHDRIADAFCFVLSSDYEGLSNALLEAMSLGLPCISTNCAGVEDYIINSENGLIVAVGDSEGLASAMKRMIDDPVLREKCGRSAKNVKTILNKDVVLERWHNVID